VHCAETRLSEASTRATAGAIFQTEIVKRSRRITVFCFEIHIGTRIRIVSACQIPFLRKNIEGLYNRNRVRSRRITVFCFKIQIRISRVTTFCSVARQRTCVYEYSCTRTTPPPSPIPPNAPTPVLSLPRGGTKKKMPARQQFLRIFFNFFRLFFSFLNILFDSYHRRWRVSLLVTTCNAQKRKPELQRSDDSNNRTVALSAIQT
jgi:hypothetical protein